LLHDGGGVLHGCNFGGAVASCAFPSSSSVFIMFATALLGYVNHYPEGDNPFGVKLPEAELLNNSFAFLVADYGLLTKSMSSGCCQTDVADLMRAKRAELEAAGKTLLFVGAGGDNFYYHGLRDSDKDADTQWARWDMAYKGLTDVPWVAAMGNHDFGDADKYATCAEKAPRTTVEGQNYASNQLDVDKGGYRPKSLQSAHNFHLPDFNYRMRLDALNLEVFGLDQNYVDAKGIGGGPDGQAEVLAACGYGNWSGLEQRLHEIGRSGEELLSTAAAKGAHNASRTRNVLVIQHYPGVCASLKDKFAGSLPAGETLDFRCSFGHTHNTVCESGTDAHCAFSMNGGGGGCCSDDVTKSGAGFSLLTFTPAGGMNIEMVRLGRPCRFEPEGMDEDEKLLAERYKHGDDHQSSFTAVKLEINAGTAVPSSIE
jgi:hypothetical protein